MDTALTENNGLSNGKSIDCGACGDSGCCSPLGCKMTNKSKYCNRYLEELKSGYQHYTKMYSLIYDNKEKYPELFEAVEKLKEDAEDAWNR